MPKSLPTILSDIVRKTTEYDNCGREHPDWLKAQIEAVYQMENDFPAGLRTLTEATKDELDYLESL